MASLNKIPHNGYAIIIGAMKCGTSSLYNYLIKHPAICPSAVKEPEFFSSNQTYGHKVDHYEDLWDFDPNVHRYALEASTGYTKYAVEKDVPETIYKYGIMPKFIYIVRDPFERILSHHGFARYQVDVGSDWSVVSDHMINVSNYYLQLRQYRKYFSKEQILIIDFDDVTSDPQSVLTKVFRFLDLPEMQIPKKFSAVNKTKTLSKFQMFLEHYPALRKPYLLLPQKVRDLGKKAFKKYSVPEDKRQLTDQERTFIYDRLADDMRKFHEEYGIDVVKWGFNT